MPLWLSCAILLELLHRRLFSLKELTHYFSFW
ncbi:hypothetical protein GYH30_055666 [Glycine max]|nr:hypothetical protein GYH30_055666 [Glycine max]